MRHALEALVDLQPATEQYVCRFTPNSAEHTLLVEVEWDNRRHGKDLVSRVHFDLPDADDSTKSMQDMLNTLLRACNTLAAEAATKEQDCRQALEEAQNAHRQLDEYAKRKEAFDADVALKTAALLVGKDEKAE